MHQWLREFTAECLGTMIYIALGCGAVAVNLLSNSHNYNVSEGIGFGIGILIGVSIAAPISGAHLNPAVTVALCATKKLQWKKVFVYLGAQYVGGFLGAALVYGTYYTGIKNYEYNFRWSAFKTNTTFNRYNVTGEIFATYPREYIGVNEVLADQIISCAILMIALLAITDQNGINTPPALQPFSLALVYAVLNVSFGRNCGAILNPARDLSPRIFSAFAGYGFDVFKPLEYHYWWAAGIVAPHIGAIIGAWIYLVTVGMHNPCINQEFSSSNVSTVSTMPITKSDMLYDREQFAINENLKVTSMNE